MSQNRSSHTNVLERRFIPFSIEVLCETIEWRTRFEDIMFGQQAEIPDFAQSQTDQVRKPCFVLHFHLQELLFLLSRCAFGAINAQGQEYSLTIEATPAVTEEADHLPFLRRHERRHGPHECGFWQQRIRPGIQRTGRRIQQPVQCQLECFWNQSRIFGHIPGFGGRHLRHCRTGRSCFDLGHSRCSRPRSRGRCGQPITPFFLTDGATTLLSNTPTGASWYILNTASNGLPDGDMRVLIMQVTTSGALTGTMNAQVFPLGVGTDQQLVSWEFDGAGTYEGGDVSGCTDPEACNYVAEAMADDGSCDYFSCIVSGCTDSVACNYNAEATADDGSCDFARANEKPLPTPWWLKGSPPSWQA